MSENFDRTVWSEISTWFRSFAVMGSPHIFGLEFPTWWLFTVPIMVRSLLMDVFPGPLISRKSFFCLWWQVRLGRWTMSRGVKVVYITFWQKMWVNPWSPSTSRFPNPSHDMWICCVPHTYIHLLGGVSGSCNECYIPDRRSMLWSSRCSSKFVFLHNLARSFSFELQQVFVEVDGPDSVRELTTLSFRSTYLHLPSNHLCCFQKLTVSMCLGHDFWFWNVTMCLTSFVVGRFLFSCCIQRMNKLTDCWDGVVPWVSGLALCFGSPNVQTSVSTWSR